MDLSLAPAQASGLAETPAAAEAPAPTLAPAAAATAPVAAAVQPPVGAIIAHLCASAPASALAPVAATQTRCGDAVPTELQRVGPLRAPIGRGETVWPGQSVGADLNLLSKCAKALTKEKQMVPYEALVRAVLDHNEMMATIANDLEVLSAHGARVAQFGRQVMGALASLEMRVSGCEKSLEEQHHVLRDTEKQMENISSQLGRLSELEKRQADNDARAAEVKKACERLMEQHHRESTEARQLADQQATTLDEHTRAIRAVKDKFQRLSDDLYITTDQVVVAKRGNMTLESVGSGQRQDDHDDNEDDVSLSVLLERMSDSTASAINGLEVQRRTAHSHAQAIGNKAGIAVEALAQRNKSQIDRLQAFVNANMDVDLMDVRRKQDQLLATIEDYKDTLEARPTEDALDEKIKHKYDGLLRQVQRALAAVKDDETAFKACIESIETKTRDLKTETATDRSLADARLLELAGRLDRLEQKNGLEPRRMIDKTPRFQQPVGKQAARDEDRTLLQTSREVQGTTMQPSRKIIMGAQVSTTEEGPMRTPGAEQANLMGNKTPLDVVITPEPMPAPDTNNGSSFDFPSKQPQFVRAIEGQPESSSSQQGDVWQAWLPRSEAMTLLDTKVDKTVFDGMIQEATQKLSKDAKTHVDRLFAQMSELHLRPLKQRANLPPITQQTPKPLSVPEHDARSEEPWRLRTQMPLRTQDGDTLDRPQTAPRLAQPPQAGVSDDEVFLPAASKATVSQDTPQAFRFRCLSCQAPLMRLAPATAGPSGRTLGAGFKTDVIARTFRDPALRQKIELELLRKVKWEQSLANTQDPCAHTASGFSN